MTRWVGVTRESVARALGWVVNGANVDPVVPSYTWDTKPSSPTAGQEVWISDAGAGGSKWRYTGTQWKPINGTALLASLDTTSSNIANSETVVFQYQAPAGMYQVGDRLRATFTFTKSGTTDTGALHMRMGTAGTTADTSIGSLSSLLAAGNRSVGLILDFRIESATSIQRMPNGSLAIAGYSTGSSATVASAVAISNISNSLFFNISIASSSTNDTVALVDAHLFLIPKAN